MFPTPPLIPPFSVSRIPEIHFGAGSLAELPRLVRRYGQHTLLVTSGSFARSARHAELREALARAGIAVEHVILSGEPSPVFVDAAVARFRTAGLDSVVGIGGGSALDAGKAISAMLPQDGSVAPFLECFDTRRHDGRKLPYIAVPTSAGTGSEATKNAVLSLVGADGYKSSLRHDNFVPEVALVDPALALTCPPDVTAACGLDALTQLLEAYVSSRASPMTDALAFDGLQHAAAGFIRACEDGRTDIEARSHMAYAALLSGIVLANAGLGIVHGFAGPLGGLFPIPHGVACGTLLAESTRATIAALQNGDTGQHQALEKYARAGVILSGRPCADAATGCARLVSTLELWIERTGIARLAAFGVTAADLPRIVGKSGNKNNPAKLGHEQMQAILTARL